MNFLRKIKILAAVLLLSLTVSFGYTAFATADAKADVCAGVSQTGGNCFASGSSDISKAVKVVIQILTLIAGVAAVVMIITAGLKFITSGGDASGVSSAKNSLVYALVGLVVVALSQVIVHFVLGKV